MARCYFTPVSKNVNMKNKNCVWCRWQWPIFHIQVMFSHHLVVHLALWATWHKNIPGYKFSLRRRGRVTLCSARWKTQIIQANLSLKHLLLKAASKRHSLMHGLLTTTCKAFGMQPLQQCDTQTSDRLSFHINTFIEANWCLLLRVRWTY